MINRYVDTLLLFLSLLSALMFPQVLSIKYFTSCLWRLTYFTETSEVLAANSQKPQVFSISRAPVSSSARLNEWIMLQRANERTNRPLVDFTYLICLVEVIVTLCCF